MSDWQVDIELLDRLPEVFEHFTPIEHQLPEAKLWQGVIYDAIAGAWSGDQEDKAWLFDPFYAAVHSFEDVCALIQLDADGLRAWLFREWGRVNTHRKSMVKLAKD